MTEFHYAILIQILADIREQMMSIKGIKHTSSVNKNGVVMNSIKVSGQNITGACVCTSNWGIISSKTLFTLWCSERNIVTDIKDRRWIVFKFRSDEFMAISEDDNVKCGDEKKYMIKYFNHKS